MSEEIMSGKMDEVDAERGKGDFTPMLLTN